MWHDVVDVYLPILGVGVMGYGAYGLLSSAIRFGKAMYKAWRGREIQSGTPIYGYSAVANFYDKKGILRYRKGLLFTHMHHVELQPFRPSNRGDSLEFTRRDCEG